MNKTKQKKWGIRVNKAGNIAEVGGDVDWLALAIYRVGKEDDSPDSPASIAKAAEALGVSKPAIYNWLENGLCAARFERVVRLSVLSGIALSHLAERVGKFQGAPSPTLTHQKLQAIRGSRKRDSKKNGNAA